MACRTLPQDTKALMERVSALASKLESNPEYTGEEFEEEIKNLYNGDEFAHVQNKEDLFRKVLGFYDLSDMDFTPKKSEDVIPQLAINSLNHDNFKQIYARANSAYNYMESRFKNLLFKYTFLNRDRSAVVHIIDTSEKFNSGIINLKNFLISEIVNNLNLNSDQYKKIFSRAGADIALYNQLMNSDQVKNFLNSVDLTDASQENTINLNTHTALYILNNFDNLISSLMGGLIQLDLTKKGSLMNTKYAKEIEGQNTTYWLDDTHEAKNSENFVSNLAKLIITTIQKVDGNLNPIPGRYMSTADLFMISGLLKQAEYEYNILHPEDQICILSNQKQSIKKLLTTEYQIPVFERFKSELYPLKQFLYSIGDPDIMSVSEIFNEYLNTARTSNKINTTASDILDIEGVLAFELNKNIAPTYVQYDNKGIAKTVNLSQVFRLSGEIYDNMLANLQSAIMSNTVPELFTKRVINTTRGIKNLYEAATNRDEKLREEIKNSKIFQDAFKIIFGTELTSSLVDQLGTKIIGNSISLFDTISSRLKERILNRTINPEELQTVLDEILSDIKSNSTFSNISQQISLEKDDTPYTTFDNYEGSSIPVFRLNSAMFNDIYYIQNYDQIHEYGDISNFFINNLHVLSQINDPDVLVGQAVDRNRLYPGSTGIKLDVGSNVESEDASKMSSDALFMSDFLGNFVSMLLQKDVVAVQPTEYSDKTSIMLKFINMKAMIKHPFLGKVRLGDLTTEGWQQLFYFYRKNQLSNLVIHVLNTWNKFSNDEVKTISNDEYKALIEQKVIDPTLAKKIESLWKKCDEYLSKLSAGDIENRLRELDFDIQLTNELHYSLYDKKPHLNKDIWYNFTSVLSKDNFEKWNKSKLDSLLSRQIVRDTLDKSLKEVVRTQISQLSGDFVHIPTDQEIQAVLKDKIPEAYLNGIFQPEELLKKYLLINNFFATQYIDLTVKEPYIDKVKKTIPGDDRFEDSERFKASTKRMVILPGTVENFTRGLLNGIPNQIKVSVISDPSESVFNIKGERHKQDIFDGSGYISPFYSRLVNNSLPGRGILGTKKSLGIHTGDYYASLYKWAEFEITNWKMRNSIGGKYDLHLLFKKMHNSDSMALFGLDLTKNFFGKDFSLLKASKGKRLFYSEGLYNYEILGLEKNSNETYTVYRNIVDDSGYQLTFNEVPQTSNLENVSINSIYDLWKILGGYECKELIDGKLQYSELNNDIVTEYINNIGTYYISDSGEYEFYQPLKSAFISVAANASAVKRGITNQNSSKNIWENSSEDDDGKLLYSQVNTEGFGIQLDANHEADQGELTEMSQMISALASLGYTQEFAKEAYEEIANIIKSNVLQLSNDVNLIRNNRLETVLQQASRELVEDLAHEHKISLAEAIASKLSETLGFILPFSNVNFYNLLSKSILGDLNRSALKRKYSGIAGILNPTSNVLQVYRLNGKVYLKEDLIREARDKFKKYLTYFLEDLSTEDLVKIYIYNEHYSDAVLSELSELENNFLNGEQIDLITFNKDLHEDIIDNPIATLIPITQDKVRILDTVIYKTITSDNYEQVSLSDYETYMDFKSRQDIKELFINPLIPRDLAPQDILWEENGIQRSIWEGDISEMNLFTDQIFENQYKIDLNKSELIEDGTNIQNLEC